MKKNIIHILLTSLIFFLSYLSYGELKIENKEAKPFSPKIDTELNLTSLNGAVNLGLVLKLGVGDTAVIKFSDGNKAVCLVKTTEFVDNKVFKIFGDVINAENAAFGFIFDKSGKIGGAVMFKDKNLTYSLVYNDELKCFYFVADKMEKN